MPISYGSTMDKYTVLDLGYDRSLVRPDQRIATPELQSIMDGVNSKSLLSGTLSATMSQELGALYANKTAFDNTVAGYRLGIDTDGIAKFYIGDATSYINWDGSTLTITGGLSVSSIDIGGADATSFHVDVDGNMWLGAATFGSAPAKISNAGAATFSSITITGGSITGTPISSIPNNSSTDISLLEKTWTMIFSVTDSNTIAWGAGTVTLSNGRTFSISSGNTGNMSALTYIYIDPAVSSTVLQTTTTAATAMGANKCIIGVAQNNTVTANFIPYGPSQALIDGANIGALSIVAANIAASTITAAKLSVTTLSAITADLGSITAGTIVLPSGGYIRSGQTAYDTGTGFYLGNDSSTPKFSIGNSSGNKLTWDGTTLTVGGTLNHVAGDLLYQSANTTRTEAAATYTKKKEIVVNRGGSYRIKFDLSLTLGNANTAYGRIYVNGVAVGTERTKTDGTYVTYTEDISGVEPGDLIQLYAKLNNVDGSNLANVRNFQLYVTDYDSSTVNTD
jgi:hypothetical protein